ncbi:ABC-three component system middle component 1 [Shewanella sp. YLB-07]|uniref:ABC-three component system middle component 1 n=1 Tax=Shewanella sp. YLB-07 TaxID=2601268 RepID=UPI00128AF76B|nr:ABC-three component system middle component 1 [Shewanella sp. YLB-07]MPY24424.1 hypothetical protein [Shewanella sp. YLB-07]
MDKFFDKLMARIFVESQFSLAKTPFTEGDWSTSVYIAHKPHGDYFIYLNLPENLLADVINDIQIKLFSLIKDGFEQFEQLSVGGLDDVEISPSFDKNATLIIFTSHEIGEQLKVLKQSIAIEEDPYFFKKQVLSVTTNERTVVAVSFDQNKDNYTSYLQGLISDVERFNEFTSTKSLGLNSSGIEYFFTAKLYEKLPFLTLLVKESNQQNLQQQIDNKLSTEQRINCSELLALDINKLDEWINEIVKETVDD